MTPERYQRICQLFDEVLELAPEQRAAFLAERCGDDVALRAEVEKFLAGLEPAEDYLARPAMNVAAEMLAQQQQNPSILGQQISHYQIIALLGAGGMGRVFLARDTRLGRQVALKLLPTQYTRDAERVHRFQTEAKAASALNHPNILTIHDVGQEGGNHFIATEYVEGQTLRQRLLTGSLTLSETLDVTLQVTDALAAAHRAGIVHRDIKPENIMLRPDGLVKVLDFGLAKLIETRKTEGSRRNEDAKALLQDASISYPSLFRAHPSTMPGKVMGTISYMSPEQALGQAVDARTDLFSLGVVLYEMLTGTQPFVGNSDAAVYDAILHQSPAPLRQSLPQLPAEMEWILNRTLEKDCEVRYQTASDLKAALLTIKRNSGSGAAAVSQASIPPPSVPSDRQARRAKAAAVISLLVVLALVGIWLWRNRNTTKLASARQPVSFTRLTTQAGQELYPSLSPDGKQLVYASNEVGNLDIWLQRVGGKTAINLTRDSAADDTEPAFSPDGEHIVFRSERGGGGLFLMGATGESVRRLTPDGHNPAWSPDGKEIVYAIGFFSGGPNNRTTVPSALHAINVQTGATRLITKGDAVQPHWSPNAQRIAYWGVHRGGQRDLWTVAAGGGESVLVTDDAAVDWNPIWAPDGRALYFASDRSGSMNLWRVPIDEQTGQVQGSPEPLTTPAAWSGYLSGSRDGRRLVYTELKQQINLWEVAFDPVKRQTRGVPVAITRGSNIARQQRISNDQQWIVFCSLGDQQEDIYLIHRDGTGLRQLTNDVFKDRAPSWSPDDKHIIFMSDRTGRYELWQINPDGSGLQQRTWTTGPQVQYSHWAPDGSRILCSRQVTSPFLFDPYLPWSQQAPQPLPTAGLPDNLIITSWSHNGQKLIGHRNGIITYSFATQQYERLTDSGYMPAWLNDGRHALFYVNDKLNLLDTQTRQVTQVLSVAPGKLEGAAVAKDNRFLSLSVNTTESDLWLMNLP